jgi:hypothetical protein
MTQNKFFWDVIKKFNDLMNNAIKGPDCTDPSVCKGDCCDIQINIPKVLAKEYIARGLATKEDFIRSNVYSFKLRFNYDNAKCVLFDPIFNGCSVHQSGIKPPECWIYPTGFSNDGKIEYSCKKANGWEIIDYNKLFEAEALFEKYKFLCSMEAKLECKKIHQRILNSKKSNFIKELQKIKPSKLAGFQDAWDSIKPLLAEGYSLQLKDFCMKYNNNCKYLPTNFLKCENICLKIAKKLIFFLEKYLLAYCNQVGFDVSGQYPFYKLFNFAEV